MAKKHDDDKGYDDHRLGASDRRVGWTRRFSILSHARKWWNFAAWQSPVGMSTAGSSFGLRATNCGPHRRHLLARHYQLSHHTMTVRCSESTTAPS